MIDHVPSGRLYLDGNRLIPADSPVLKGRHRVIYNGMAVLTLAVDHGGALLADPQIAVQGLIDPEGEADVLEGVLAAVEEELARLPARLRADDERLSETARTTVRRAFFRAIGKKPVTQVHLLRL